MGLSERTQNAKNRIFAEKIGSWKKFKSCDFIYNLRFQIASGDRIRLRPQKIGTVFKFNRIKTQTQNLSFSVKKAQKNVFAIAE